MVQDDQAFADRRWQLIQPQWTRRISRMVNCIVGLALPVSLVTPLAFLITTNVVSFTITFRTSLLLLLRAMVREISISTLVMPAFVCFDVTTSLLVYVLFPLTMAYLLW